MTPFRAWRQRLGLTQAQAAKALGRSKRSIERLDQSDVLPRETDLACKRLEEHPEEIVTYVIDALVRE